jgi:Uncharacterized alpha/beta hydrolase domain (DUF2235)
VSENKNPGFLQGADNLRLAANMAGTTVGPTTGPTAPATGALAVAAKAREATAGRTPPAHTCHQRLKLSFYFDGTGNNRDADVPTYEHSNVARMFRAAPDDSAPDGIYSFYIPGLGTYFSEIGDNGESAGKAFGRRGEQRLQWALKKLQERRAMAKNLTCIDIAVFGFSRGAALARAFANRVQKLCDAAPTGAGWVIKGSTVAVDIYFMGLWDTVASVGLPKSVNNQTKLGLLRGAIWGDAEAPEARMSERSVATIAYGRPGADPAPSGLWSWADGHADWGAEMAIPAIVSKGVHMMAGHEMRNSFPVDSVLQGGRRSSAFDGDEFVYPGVHSNVGGGYRPGEGARSSKKGQQLSLITLRVMFDKARSAGVPLSDLNDSGVDAQFRLDFALALPADPEANHAAAREYAELSRLWNRYMDHTGRATRPIGQWFLAHMKAYYGWRFWNIKKNQVNRSSQQSTEDERAAKPIEEQSKREQSELEKKIDAEDKSPQVQKARQDTGAARIKLQQAQQRLMLAQQSSGGWMIAMTPEQAQQFMAQRRQEEAAMKSVVADAQRELAAAQQAQTAAEDPMRRLEAQKATLPSQGTLGRNWQQYDDRLFADAKQLSEDRLHKRWLRPHYQALVQAWEDEFINNKGLIDAGIMKFFETYVHDSLADFALDATLPSDPRVVYVGGDEIEQFAMNDGAIPATNSRAA